MASSNRHWPSMFKSKPCNSHHPWQHDINSSLISSGCHRTPYTSSSGCEERSPEPKPRWNPKPEQIRILEAIFNSGMVNPPRDEIRKIRAQLQEYGQVGDANVFYWFQNRKSRSKHKLRNLQNSKTTTNNNNNHQTTPQPPQAHQQNPPCLIPQITTPPSSSSSSSSSSSEKSPPKEIMPSYKVFSIGFSSDVVTNSPTGSANNQIYFQTHNETTLPEPFFFPVPHNGTGGGGASTMSQGFCFSELSNVVHAQPQGPHHQENVGPCTSLLLSEMMNHHGTLKKETEQEKDMKIMHHHHHHHHPHLSFCVTSSATPTIHSTATIPSITTTTTTVTVPSPITQIQGAGEPAGAAKSTVFINDVAFEVAVGPFNVREAFGDDAVLVHASGHPVLTNEWGVTLQSLQHGAFYYLI